MRVLVIYDSVYGNTEKIAQAIAEGLGGPDETELVRVSAVTTDRMQGADLVVVGAPTQGFRPTKPAQQFLATLPGGVFKGKRVAAFDTRMGGKDASGVVRIIVKVGGYAAPRIADTLKKKGGILAVPPEGFFVKGSEGPLAEGEADRAAAWGRTVRAASKQA